MFPMKKILVILAGAAIFSFLLSGCFGAQEEIQSNEVVHESATSKYPDFNGANRKCPVKTAQCIDPENLYGEEASEFCQWIYDNCPDTVYAK